MCKKTKENGQNDEAKRRAPLTPSQLRYQTAPHPDEPFSLPDCPILLGLQVVHQSLLKRNVFPWQFS